MTEPAEATPTSPRISAHRSISGIWLLPLIALLIGGWMVYQDWSNRGQLISISFTTADGIEASKTKIKVLNVEVGKVESVQFNYANNNVLVKARIEPDAEELLFADTRFWVVRPRIGTEGVSGLGTLLSGGYIEMSPGKSGQTPELYTGLEEPPATSASEPGLRLELSSDNAHSLSVGDKVIFRGFPVGRIESVSFDPLLKEAVYGVFIQAPYDQLVSSNSRFWNMSGINLNFSADGVNLQTGTLDTLLSGGITFDVLEGEGPGRTVTDGERFRLYPDFNTVKEQPYAFYQEYLLLFDQSVRGLSAGAPVEFRGVRVGTVERISFQLASLNAEQDDPRIPVVIRLEPGRLGLADEQAVLSNVHNQLSQWVKRGMRASLKSGNLVTGSMFIDLDVYADAEPATITEQEGYQVLPTTSGGFVQLENKLIAVLTKIEQLPIEPVVQQLGSTLKSSEQAIKQLDATLQQVEQLTGSASTLALPGELQQTLSELRRTARGLSQEGPVYHDLQRSLQTLQQTLQQLQPVLKTLDENPNALIFDQPEPADPIPGGRND